MTVTSDVEFNCESLAVSRKSYVPGALKLAVVTVWFELRKVTVPGPLTEDHVVFSVLPEGRPSSLAAPVRFAEAGKLTVKFFPAKTAGARLVAVESHVTVPESEPKPTEATIVSTPVLVPE